MQASAGRTKHLRRRFSNGLREHVMNGDISVHYLATILMIVADILTKPLGPTASFLLNLRPLLMLGALALPPCLGCSSCLGRLVSLSSAIITITPSHL